MNDGDSAKLRAALCLEDSPTDVEKQRGTRGNHQRNAKTGVGRSHYLDFIDRWSLVWGQPLQPSRRRSDWVAADIRYASLRASSCRDRLQVSP
jgi:hypothetical protein